MTQSGFTFQAMKGFLVTQEEAVKQVLKAGKRLLGDSSFDQEDIQDTLDGVQERWSELNTKVSEYETWLESSLKAVQSYRDTLAQINEFLDEAEKTVQECSSFAGDSDVWHQQLEQLQVGRTFIMCARFCVHRLSVRHIALKT